MAEIKGLYRQWYVLSTGDQVVAANGMTPKSIRVPDDSDFELASIGIAKYTSQLFKFQIKQAAQDKYLSNNPIPYQAIAGKGATEDAKDVYDMFPEGRVIFPSGTDIVVELTDYSGSQNTVDFVLIGHKIKAIR